MPTPMFKVLAQSLRLGQPPDAATAIRVLVEVAEKQQAEIEDLRAKLTIATSRLQYAEARIARVIELAGAGDAGGEQAPPREAARSQRPPPQPPGLEVAIPAAPRAAAIPLASAPLVDTGLDDFNQTLVIDKRDVAQVAGAEAPFPLAPASERPRPPHAAGTPFQRPDDDAPPTSRGARASFRDDDSGLEEAPLEILHDDTFLGEGEVTTRHRRDPGRE